MLRKLVNYKKLSHEVAALLIETYPHGYGDSDIISFKNMHGETVEAVELKTKEIIYLVKISKSLSNFIANFDDVIEKELEAKPNVKSKELKHANKLELTNNTYNSELD
ncbi:hypothetical protein KO500_07055 [Cellulophaga baltica]|uniref:hypothetical protein n=1 Tax=Cellulophaga TaxID=104264 RepID=UPI001C07A9B7|nr:MULTISPECIES: hypothetical protein [Cellulophaga]MBU2996185.1 hypothetical protein [Cellulophaga baltica]MDO6767580.1 hypothetical protein [Cellulophaga sp. 1_MG-2023]